MSQTDSDWIAQNIEWIAQSIAMHDSESTSQQVEITMERHDGGKVDVDVPIVDAGVDVEEVRVVEEFVSPVETDGEEIFVEAEDGDDENENVEVVEINGGAEEVERTVPDLQVQTADDTQKDIHESDSETLCGEEREDSDGLSPELVRKVPSGYSLLSAYGGGGSSEEESEVEKNESVPEHLKYPPLPMRQITPPLQPRKSFIPTGPLPPTPPPSKSSTPPPPPHSKHPTPPTSPTGPPRANLQTLYQTLEEVLSVKARLSRSSSVGGSSSAGSRLSTVPSSSGSTLFDELEHTIDNELRRESLDSSFSGDGHGHHIHLQGRLGGIKEEDEDRLGSRISSRRAPPGTPLPPPPPPPPSTPLPQLPPTHRPPTPPSDDDLLSTSLKPNTTKALKTLGIISETEASKVGGGAVQGNNKALKMLGLANTQSDTPKKLFGGLRSSKSTNVPRSNIMISTTDSPPPPKPHHPQISLTPALPTLCDINPLHTSFLHKFHPSHLFKPWRRRFFALTPDGFIYQFKSNSPYDRAVDSLPVFSATEVVTGLDHVVERRGGFSVRTGQKTWVLADDNGVVVDAWKGWVNKVARGEFQQQGRYEEEEGQEQEQYIPPPPNRHPLILHRKDSISSTGSSHPNLSRSMSPHRPPHLSSYNEKRSSLTSVASSYYPGEGKNDGVSEAIRLLDGLLAERR